MGFSTPTIRVYFGPTTALIDTRSDAFPLPLRGAFRILTRDE
jgi:hypothetical protein